MCYIDLEPADVWSETHRKARKQHRCSCCLRAIKPGEQYLVHWSIYDGDGTSAKCCAECEADRAAFASEHESMVPTPDYFFEILRECASDEEDKPSRWQPMLNRIAASRKVNKAV